MVYSLAHSLIASTDVKRCVAVGRVIYENSILLHKRVLKEEGEWSIGGWYFLHITGLTNTEGW